MQSLKMIVLGLALVGLTPGIYADDTKKEEPKAEEVSEDPTEEEEGPELEDVFDDLRKQEEAGKDKEADIAPVDSNADVAPATPKTEDPETVENQTKTEPEADVADINSSQELRAGARELRDEEVMTAEVFGRSPEESLRNLQAIVRIDRAQVLGQVNDGTFDDQSKEINLPYRVDLEKAQELGLEVGALNKLRVSRVLYDWQTSQRDRISEGLNYLYLDAKMTFNEEGVATIHFIGARRETAPHINGRSIGACQVTELPKPDPTPAQEDPSPEPTP